ncbi:MAG: zinc dependent phospholipase C family protein [Candidatus Stygibacter australis]|nr:zinc dependent phospholipase C family protein [Candidatus Stygibacter australis]MDP8322718.1 zinc dependent phospholipase C family protein [Candidatus Stygibacter australis]
MAGVITHLIAGSNFLKKQKLVAKEYHGCFLLGSCYPDAGYFPGEKSIISDLAHYLMAARIARYLFQETSSESWKAFALGWLFHLQTDLAIHPMVNKLAAQYHYGAEYNDQIYTYEQSPLIHALIENELDCKLLRVSSIDQLCFTTPVMTGLNPISKAFEDFYSLKLDDNYLNKMIIKLPGKLKFIYRSLTKLENMKALKQFTIWILQILRKLLGESKYILIKNFIAPDQIDDEKFSEYQQAIAELIDKISHHDLPQWFSEDYNFDTGNISKLGEYKIADRLFTELDGNENKSLIWDKFKVQFCKKDGGK